jgi:hypothetical protein
MVDYHSMRSIWALTTHGLWLIYVANELADVIIRAVASIPVPCLSRDIDAVGHGWTFIQSTFEQDRSRWRTTDGMCFGRVTVPGQYLSLAAPIRNYKIFENAFIDLKILETPFQLFVMIGMTVHFYLPSRPLQQDPTDLIIDDLLVIFAMYADLYFKRREIKPGLRTKSLQ